MLRLWSTVTAAPHRTAFLPGAFMAVVALLWWLPYLLDRQAGGTGMAPEALPGPLLHGWLMVYGLFPFFVFGFLFTALPNWLNAPPITRPAYAATGVLLAVGGGLMFFSPLAGLVLHLAGWGVGLTVLGDRLATSPPQDKHHGWIAWGGLALGWLGNSLALAWLLTDITHLWAWSEALGLWGFLVPVFLAVCHRMVPWFTSRVVANYLLVRPFGPLGMMLAASLGHGALAALGRGELTWLVDLPLAALAFWFVSRWGIARSFGVRLLAMLHIGFVWAGVAFLLHGLDSLAGFLGLPWSAGLAPLHALGIGFFGAMLVGMASRVSLGHSGRPLVADGVTWGLFWLVQGAALVRMLPEMLPLPGDVILWMTLLSGLFWLAAFGTWAWKYAPLYWRPRADGKPG